VEKYDRARQATDDNIMKLMRISCWISKAADTQSEYVILIASPRQRWLRERASLLPYTYIACLASVIVTGLILRSCLWVLYLFVLWNSLH
jgi:hypothetical protein